MEEKGRDFSAQSLQAWVKSQARTDCVWLSNDPASERKDDACQVAFLDRPWSYSCAERTDESEAFLAGDSNEFLVQLWKGELKVDTSDFTPTPLLCVRSI